MAVEIDLANEVVTALNGETFSVPVESLRAWLPVFDPEELDGLEVRVIPKRLTPGNAARAVKQKDVEIGIAVQKRLTVADTADGDDPEIDGLAGLANEILEFLDGLNMTSGKFTSIDQTPIVDPISLHQHRLFTSIITPTYRAYRRL